VHRFFNLAISFGRDERGVFAVIFGLMAIVLVAMGGAVVDFVSLEQARNRAQIALDAAALALQPEIFTSSYSEDTVKQRAQALLVERVGAARGLSVNIVDVEANEELGTLYLQARLEMPTLFVQLVGVRQMTTGVESQVTSASSNIEVAVAVDITGSMADPVVTDEEGDVEQTKVQALSAALTELIDLVVKDEQEPTYSKMAIVPYSMAVNVGTGNAQAMRGAVITPKAVTAVGWAAATSKPISGATRANPVVITSNGHGLNTGDYVYINNVGGMTQINNKIFQVTSVTPNTYRLNGVNGNSYNNYNNNSSGTGTKCAVSTCELVVTALAHGLVENQAAYLYGVGMSGSSLTSINNNSNGYTSGTNLYWQIGRTTANTFVLPGTARTNGLNYGTYTSGGHVSCLEEGCEYYLFRNRYNSWRRQQISTCVTERSSEAFTDASASTARLGRNYPSLTNPCLSNTIVPLTDSKTTLHSAASGLRAGGSTGGHIGVAWAWYLLSHDFGGPWPSASQPAPATRDDVVKAVVIMTDGEFNSVYCRGVISQSSTNGSGDTNNHINCNAPNGDSYTQSNALCTAMKNEGIIVYTVGFAIVNSQNAQDLMDQCATDANHVYEANTGQELVEVFQDIGRDLSQLRVSR
jgi:Flp pilus assembly protein TadG